MRKKQIVLAAKGLLLIGYFFGISGCGGGGDSNRSSLTIVVNWPQFGRMIPAASRSIRVTLTANQQQVAERLLVRTSNDSYTARFTFTDLPPTQVIMTATAFPNTDGTGTAQATTSMAVDLEPGRDRQISLTMTSTVAQLRVSPNSLSLPTGQTAQLSVAALDTAGNVVLISPSKIVWTSSNAGVATLTPDGDRATVRGVSPGTANISVREQESGRSTQIPVTVNPTGTGGRIVGRVTDPTGTPLAGVRVETSDGNYLWRTNTGADGRYTLENVPSGRRVVTFSRQGFTTSFQIAVAQGGEVLLDAVLQNFNGTITSPPEITLNQPVVNRERGQATISGRISRLDHNAAVLITNGGESVFLVNDDGTFSVVTILRNGLNSIYVRASNGFGTVTSQEVRINYTPPSDFYFRVTLTWDGLGDVDLHTWDPNNSHSYYGNQTIPTGELDTDNTVSFGPENFTCRVLTPGRYKIAVNSYSNATGRRATIRVIINQGPNAGQYDYGPYTFTGSNQNSGYPVRGNTPYWWRPVDVLVSQDGVVSVTAPDTSIGLNRGRASGREATKP